MTHFESTIAKSFEEIKAKAANETLEKGAYSAQRLMSVLEVIPKDFKVKIELDKILVSSDFVTYSWRGSYNLPAIEYSSAQEWCTVAEAITALKETEGTEVGGYKGGTFILSDKSPVFIANYGESNNSTAIVDYYLIGDSIIFKTRKGMY
jgi:hypothetical protein